MHRRIISISLIAFMLFGIFNVILPAVNVNASNIADDTAIQMIIEKAYDIRGSLDKSADTFQSNVQEEKDTVAKPAAMGFMALSTEAPNLIENGDFNMDPAIYGEWAAYDFSEGGSAVFTWDEQTYHGNSGYSLQIQGTDTEAYCINEVQITPGKDYDFSAWGKGLNIEVGDEDVGPYIFIAQYDASGDMIADTSEVFFNSQATFDWSNAFRSLTAAPNAFSLFVMIVLDGTGTVWYDDIFLTEVESTPENIPVTGITLDTSAAVLSVGQQLQLTATVTPDNSTNKTVAWTVQSQSTADVITLSPNGLVTAVNAGTAVIRAAGDEDASIYAECSIMVSSPLYSQLPLNSVITDTILDPAYTYLYAIDSQNKKLYAVNYATKNSTELAFDLQPERIAYSNGKLYVSLLKMPHSSYTWDEDQEGAIAIVDFDPSTGALTLNKQIDVATDPYDIAVTGDFIFLPSGSGQWTNVTSYSEASGLKVSSYSIRQQSFIDINTSLNRLYTITTDSSPRDYNAFDINNGAFTASHDSPYHGDYDMAQNFRVSPDGKYIFNGSGLVLDCDEDTDLDLRFKFMLGSSYSDIAFDLEHERIYTAVTGKRVYYYDYETFSGLGTLNSIGEISYLYYSNGELIALSRLNGGQYIVETIDTSDSTVITPEVITRELVRENSKLLFDYTVTDTVIDPDNPVVYITDNPNKKISAINYITGAAKELSTFYSPGSIALFGEELFVGYGAQGIIGIYDSQTLVLKDSIYAGATFFDMNVGRDGTIYTSSDDYVRSYSRNTRQEISSAWLFYEGYLEVHPTLDSLYMSSMHVSPEDLFTVKHNNGTLTDKYDSVYHGDYSISSINRISPDGKFIFNSSGEVFYSSQNKVTTLNGTYDNPNTDMAHAFSLNNGYFNDVAFDLQNNCFYTGNSNGITAFNYSDFKPVEYIATSGAVVRVFNLPDQILAILKAGNSYFTEIIDKAGFGAYTGNTSSNSFSRMPVYSSQKVLNAQEITLGDTVQGSFSGSENAYWFKFTALSSGNYTITYPQNASCVVVFDSNGFETAFREYSGNLTIRMEENKHYYIAVGNYYYSGSYTFSVSMNQPVTEINLNKASVTINVGSTEQLVATVLPQTAADKSVVWSIQSQSAANVVTVSSTGLVRGINPGTVVIRAASASNSNIYTECSITVTAQQIAVTGVTLNKTEITLTAGLTEQLISAVLPANASNKSITWSITDQSSSNVVTISTTGLVAAVSPGTATVRAASNADNSKYAECTVTVVDNSITSGIITTFAGIDSYGYYGDGGEADAARLYTPMDLVFDGYGNMYIADYNNHRVRKVSQDGSITTYAGTGVAGNKGDGGPATSAMLYYPRGLAVDNAGNLYISDVMNQNIRKVSPDGIISTVAGTGVYGYSGDGGPAASAKLGSPAGVAVDGNGNLYIADYANCRIRMVNSAGIISTVAGTGTNGYSGDGGAAVSAKLDCPWGVAIDGNGNMYISDFYNNRIRKVSSSGIISTIAGTGIAGYSGDGAAASAAKLNHPTGLAIDSQGNLLIADQQNNKIRKIDLQGNICTVAGIGTSSGYLGDGSPAVTAQLFNPTGVALDAYGNIYIADSFHHRVRKVTVTSQTPAAIAVSGVSLNKTSVTRSVGETEQLEAAVNPENATNKDVIWIIVSQSAYNVVNITQSGLVTAVNAGTAVIRATSLSDPDKFAECSIIVNSPSVSPPTYEADIWSVKTSMPTRRNGAGIAVLDDRIYVIGGYSINGTMLGKMEIYDPALDTWATGPDMPTIRHGLKAFVLDGKIYAVGGYSNGSGLNTVEMYDPVTNTWTAKTGLNDERVHFGGGVINGKIYIAGGHSNGAVNTIEEYDASLDRWTVIGDMPAEYNDYYSMASVVAGGDIYFIGGDREQGGVFSRSKKVIAYNPASGLWTRKADMPTARFTQGAAELNGLVYVMGGIESDVNGGLLKTVEEYNPLTDTWIAKLDMPTARSYPSVITVLGRIYAIGGMSAGVSVSALEEYEPQQISSEPVAVTGIILDKTSVTMKKEQTVQLSASVTPDNAADKSYHFIIKSQNPDNVISVSPAGLVTAMNPGIAVVRVISNSDSSKYADFSIIVSEPVTSDFDITQIPNNTLKLGDDFYDLNSNEMKDPNAATALASLLKDGPNKNKAYFKFGGKWYSLFELTQEQFLDPAYALTDEKVDALSVFGKWYRAEGDVVAFAQGSYTLSQINQFSITLIISIDSIQDASYYNVYSKSNNSHVNPVPLPLNEGLTTLPAAFSNISNLEVWLYSDVEETSKVAVLKLEGNGYNGILVY